MIQKGYETNFKTMQKAFTNKDVCIMECMDRQTGKPVIAVCASYKDKDGMFVTVPLAKMFDGNPYEEMYSPMEVDMMAEGVPV